MAKFGAKVALEHAGSKNGAESLKPTGSNSWTKKRASVGVRARHLQRKFDYPAHTGWLGQIHS